MAGLDDTVYAAATSATSSVAFLFDMYHWNLLQPHPVRRNRMINPDYAADNAAIVCTLSKLFEDYDRDTFAIACEKYVSGNRGMQVGKLLRESWKDCYDFLRRELGNCKWARDIYAAFEFKMPNSQKRADVILLTKEKVVILEFKHKENACLRDALQVGGYHQSIESFHSETIRNNMDVRQFLTLTKPGKTKKSSVVDILDGTDFRSTLHTLFKNDTSMALDDAKNGQSHLFTLQRACAI